MTGRYNAGTRMAWEALAAREPQEAARCAGAVLLDRSRYRIRSFGSEFLVSLADRTVTAASPQGREMMAWLGEFFPVAIIWHLAQAKDVPATGRLIRPQDIPGGDIFVKGAHVLPLDEAAQRWGARREQFLERGRSLGGSEVALADVAVRLSPLPRIPVTLVLRLADDEYPARMDLLFDSTCVLQAGTDVLWSVAMMCLAVMQ